MEMAGPFTQGYSRSKPLAYKYGHTARAPSAIRSIARSSSTDTDTDMRWYANAREVGCGERVTVVLAHGFGVKQSSWDALLPSISRANKVLLFDWDFTGGGAREAREERRYTFGKFADDLIALMDEKEVRGAVLVGHSLSAMAACIASVRRPDLFAHLLLLCASPRYINSEEEGYVGGFEEAAIHGVLDAMESDFHGWVRGFVPNAAGDAAKVEPALEESFHAMDPEVALELAKMIFLGDQREVLDGVSAPCTIVQVSNDSVAPRSLAEYMQGRMKRTAAAVEIIDSVGHFPQLAAPQQLLDILDGVLRLHEEVKENDGEETEVAAADVEVEGGIHVRK